MVLVLQQKCGHSGSERDSDAQTRRSDSRVRVPLSLVLHNLSLAVMQSPPFPPSSAHREGL